LSADDGPPVLPKAVPAVLHMRDASVPFSAHFDLPRRFGEVPAWYRGGQVGSDELDQAEYHLPIRLTREHQVVPASARA
jgi:hypothetical protein